VRGKEWEGEVGSAQALSTSNRGAGEIVGAALARQFEAAKEKGENGAGGWRRRS